MKINSSPNDEKRKSFLQILFGVLIIIVVICNSGYVLMMTSEFNPAYLSVPMSAVMFFLWLKNHKGISLRSYYFASFLILLSFSVITFIFNLEFDSANLYIHTLSIIILSFCISWLIEFDTFVSIYIKFMKYITVISLMFYALYTYFDVVFDFPIISTPNADYYNGLMYFQLVNSADRNTGIFWEPGLFASFITIALVFQVSFKNNYNKLPNLTIFFLGLISTNSTAGYFLIPFVIVLIIVENTHNISYIFLLCLTIIFGIIFSEDILLLLVKLSPSMFMKLMDESTNYTTRLYAPLINLEIFSSAPIFGVGYANATNLFIEKTFLNLADSQTSTSTFFMAAMGVPGIAYTYNWIHGIFGLKWKNIIIRTTIFIIFIIIINKEPHSGLVITYCIMFYFLKEAQINSMNKLINRIA